MCPGCLLRQAATETAAPTGAINFQPPTVEELAKLFPQLEIISLIGRGGMGAVYKARQPLLDRIVALKILPELVTRGTDFSERFAREARALAKLHHPNIVMVHEFGEINGQPYFIMEYVDGLNLRQLEREGKLSAREALQIVPQICEALQFAHDAGIVHRDIKPDNILIDKKGRVKIADFGIAKILGTAEDPAMPTTQGAIGTPHYMAPEQVEKPQTVDHRADIFSLGVVFYEMLTGELPLGKFGPPSSSPRAVQVDVRLDEVVLRALERKPELRFQRASQVKTAVETIVGSPGGASFGAGTPPPGVRVEEILARDYQLQIRHSVKRGWALVKAEFWPLIGITALIIVLITLAGNVIISRVSDETTGGTSLLGLVLNGPLIGGLLLYFLKKIRREATTVETAFAGFSKRFLHLFLANLVMTLLTVLGFVCFILPGIYLLVAWWFTLALVMDKGLEFWPAMELSRKMITKHWWKTGLLMVTLALICFAGLCLCGFGIFLAAPVAIAAYLFAYEDIFGSVPPPNPLRAAAPAKPAAPDTASPGAAAGFGPSGTMVMPEANPAGGSPNSPAPAAETAAPTGSYFWKWTRRLTIALLLFVLLLVTAVALLPDFNFTAGKKRIVHQFGTANIRVIDSGVVETDGNSFLPALPLQGSPGDSEIPAAPEPPLPPTPPAAENETAFARHARQVLEKNAFRFRQIAVVAGGPSNLVVTFTGLQQQSGTVETKADSGIVITNDLATVSINANGVQIRDRKKSKRATISVPGVRIDVSGEDAAEWQAVEGSLVGSKISDSQWLFLGAGQLAALRFEMAVADLKEVLPPSANSSMQHLADRLEAAGTITEVSIKDRSLAAVAKDAANANEIQLLKSALSQMVDLQSRDAATRSAALILAKAGARKQAIELAKGITDLEARDQALAELAQ